MAMLSSSKIGIEFHRAKVKHRAETTAIVEYHDESARKFASACVLCDRIQKIQLEEDNTGKIVGKVFWVEDGMQTTKVLDAEEAFKDTVQAGAASSILRQEQFDSSAAEKKLARLACR